MNEPLFILPIYRIPILLQVLLVFIVLTIEPSYVNSAVFPVSTVADLEAALLTAAVNGDDDTLNIAPGIYNITASLSYDSHEDKSISLHGYGGEVIINGEGISQRILFMRTYTHNADITISGVKFKNGYAQEGDNGAGVFINIARADLVIENSQIIDCFAAAFYFTNNGGGAYITAGIDANVLVRNCVISGNKAKGLGGGMYLNITNGTLSFINNTVVNNRNNTSVVEGGGGVYLRLYFDVAEARFYNNILWGNEIAHGNGDLYIEDNGDFLLDGNLNAATVKVYNNDYNQLDYNLGTSLTLANNINRDPQLSTDFHMTVTSFCVDAGTSTAPNISLRDLEGESRSHDGNCDGISIPDMGADEYHGPYVSQDGTCGSNSPCYTSVQSAVDAACTGDTLKIAEGAFAEPISLNTSKLLTLNGGWNSAFTSQAPNTTIIKAPKAPNGSLTLQILTIKP